jgi:hypothetical protein
LHIAFSKRNFGDIVESYQMFSSWSIFGCFCNQRNVAVPSMKDGSKQCHSLKTTKRDVFSCRRPHVFVCVSFGVPVLNTRPPVHMSRTQRLQMLHYADPMHAVANAAGSSSSGIDPITAALEAHGREKAFSHGCETLKAHAIKFSHVHASMKAPLSCAPAILCNSAKF